MILSLKSQQKFLIENKGWEKVPTQIFHINHVNKPKFLIVKKDVVKGEVFTVPTTNFFSSMLLFKKSMLKVR